VPIHLQDPAQSFLSATGVHGTPQYMAPEQFAGGRCDEKCDVFALATVLNECATRRPPWAAHDNAFQVRGS
jgi:serine/threonine protein kinase